MTRKTARPLAIRANIWLLRFSRNWLKAVIAILFVYISLPWLAPTLMNAGITGPGNVLYTLYSPFCHQFAFRSFFLFGEQQAYPRAITGTELTPFEDYAIESETFISLFADYANLPPEQITRAYLDPFSPALQFAARDFRGDPVMGYKMTLCERDIAIYTAIFIGAILFGRVRHRLRPVPLWLYVLLGLAPIGLDGFSQMLGYPPFSFWPPRETIPVYRVMTGILFGLMNVWLGFPYLEMSFRETQEQIEAKLRKAGITV